jgi:hypothetical protein
VSGVVIFPCHLEDISLDRKRIVGFKGPRNKSYYYVYCKALLDNGQEVVMNGIWVEQAEAILSAFDLGDK